MMEDFSATGSSPNIQTKLSALHKINCEQKSFNFLLLQILKLSSQKLCSDFSQLQSAQAQAFDSMHFDFIV